jgi:2-C-methyl-D-erythritol 4-phosphate cytidylyltransferase
MTRIAVIIPAGGSGSRMGPGAVPKPMLQLGGEPLLRHCLDRFLERSDVRWVVVALSQELLESAPAWLRSDPRVSTVAGGTERGHSVRNALAAVPAEADVVLVHDAARPLVSPAVIQRCVQAAAAGESVVAAVPVVDTIQEVDDDGTIVATPDRHRLRAAQTPQAFPAEALRAAHQRAAAEGVVATDDAGLVARYGGRVSVVEGAPENIKITTPADLVVAEALLTCRTS